MTVSALQRPGELFRASLSLSLSLSLSFYFNLPPNDYFLPKPQTRAFELFQSGGGRSPRQKAMDKKRKEKLGG